MFTAKEQQLIDHLVKVLESVNDLSLEERIRVMLAALALQGERNVRDFIQGMARCYL